VSASRSVIIRSRPWICPRCRHISTKPRRTEVERRPSEKLPDTPARTRFAPSPTGYLHLGSLRTAVFNYLLAKATGGQFILRIEDTDRKRTIPDAEKRIYEDLRWAGLQWDEGPDIGGSLGPYRQSERTALYTESVQKLLQSGQAYRCFCSSRHLNKLATERHAMGLPSDYDRSCLDIPRVESEERASKGQAHIIRLKSPDVTPSFHDLVYGDIGRPRPMKKPKSQSGPPHFEDPVLLKSDGLPTYHLANVVDDHYMGITHVIRATEWLSSTPKHTYMYDALGWQPPIYAHVGLLQDKTRSKLSKRIGDPGLEFRSFQDTGIFPEALVNYVALHGWSHRLIDDFLTPKGLIDNFDLRFTKGDTIVLPNKLLYLQKRYAMHYAERGGEAFGAMVDAVHNAAEQHLMAHPGTCIHPSNEFRSVIESMLSKTAQHYTTPAEYLAKQSYMLFSEPREHAPYHQSTIDTIILDHLSDIKKAFSKIPPDKWNMAELSKTLNGFIDNVVAETSTGQSPQEGDEMAKKIKSGVYGYIRWAVVGGVSGPVMALTMSIIGRKNTLQRLDNAAASFREIRQADEAATSGS